MTSFYNLQRNEDHQDNRKEILNKPGWKYMILEKINKKKRESKIKMSLAEHGDGVRYF